MKAVKIFSRYFHTLRHLKKEQWIGRALHTVKKRIPQRIAPVPSRIVHLTGDWADPARRRTSMQGPASFVFLNHPHTLSSQSDWNSSALEKLWLYNLHYFDDLNSEDSGARTDWHRALMDRWIAENPMGHGNGWEPYPTSLRIVNWIKWGLGGNPLPELIVQSLGMQAEWLSRHLEYHLLGNHLFANAKALLFASTYLESPRAARWRKLALRILEHEIPEQILSDGGHFERSPMYHALAVEDMLDLYNLARAYPERAATWGRVSHMITDRLPAMLTWLSVMTHPDGEISFFNDAAIGIAPSPDELHRYAARLNVAGTPAQTPVHHLVESGYIRVQKGPFTFLIDVAPIGPDYLPGHAHADTLSFETSVGNQRVFVNRGTSVYGTGPLRHEQRSTAAHNTVEIDGENSSEVWGGFRVARRAYPQEVSVVTDEDTVLISASHTGFTRLPGQVVHKRTWSITSSTFSIRDDLLGNFKKVALFFHVHPTCSANYPKLVLPNGSSLLFWSSVKPHLIPSYWHPEFGVAHETVQLAIKTANVAPFTHEFKGRYDAQPL